MASEAPDTAAGHDVRRERRHDEHLDLAGSREMFGRAARRRLNPALEDWTGQEPPLLALSRRGRQQDALASSSTASEHRSAMGRTGQRRRAFARWLSTVALPVAIGAAIYLLWRSRDLEVHRWAAAVGLRQQVDAARAVMGFAREGLPTWVLMSLPDGLWAFGLSSLAALVWGRESAETLDRRLWQFATLLLAIGPELAQGASLLAGTFDRVDVALSFAGWGLAWALRGAEREHKAEAPRLRGWRHRFRRARVRQ